MIAWQNHMDNIELTNKPILASCTETANGSLFVIQSEFLVRPVEQHVTLKTETSIINCSNMQTHFRPLCTSGKYGTTQPQLFREWRGRNLGTNFLPHFLTKSARGKAVIASPSNNPNKNLAKRKTISVSTSHFPAWVCFSFFLSFKSPILLP